LLEKPDIPYEHIVHHVQEEYSLSVDGLTFLPLGADMATAVYRVAVDDKTAFFSNSR
jgi:spectinomycin phosphotransferase